MDLRYREIILFVCLTTKLLSTRFLYSMNQTCHRLVRNTSPLSCALGLQQFCVILCISSTHTKYSACSFVYLIFLLETNESKFILGGNSTLHHKCRVLNPSIPLTTKTACRCFEQNQTKNTDWISHHCK